jgi:hypothetical protein
MSAAPEGTEEHRVTGEDLVARARQLLHEGNVRRLIIKNDSGQTILELPLTFGVVGAVMMPMLAALGAIAALASHYTIVVEKHELAQAGGPAKTA